MKCAKALYSIEEAFDLQMTQIYDGLSPCCWNIILFLPSPPCETRSEWFNYVVKGNHQPWNLPTRSWNTNLFIHSVNHSINQQIFTEQLLCVNYYEQDTSGPCLHALIPTSHHMLISRFQKGSEIKRWFKSVFQGLTATNINVLSPTWVK